MTSRNLGHLGGWKDFKTVLSCYQQPDESAMREGLAARRSLVLREGGATPGYRAAVVV